MLGSVSLDFRKPPEYGFGDHSFKYRARWVIFVALTEFQGENSVPLSLWFVWQSELTEFFAELTEFSKEVSEFSLLKQYCRNSIPPASYPVLLFLGLYAKPRKSLENIKDLAGVIRANRKFEWFVRTGWRAIKIGVSIANDSRESIRANRVANRVANRPCHWVKDFSDLPCPYNPCKTSRNTHTIKNDNGNPQQGKHQRNKNTKEKKDRVLDVRIAR